jgi:lysozyme family protein
MSVQTLNRILDSIQTAEGGYWNDPVGGPTNFGITQSTLDGLREKIGGALPETVDDLDSDIARVIIQHEYLIKTRVIELPYPLSMFHGHMAVMSWDDGIRIMQERLGVISDGIIGPITLGAAKSQSSIDMLYGVYRDLTRFIETRTNGFQDSYTRRFNTIRL